MTSSDSRVTHTPPPVTEVKPAASKSPKYVRVRVEEHDGHRSHVNIRIPLALIRAGVRLTALLPAGLHDQIEQALKESGPDFEISKVKRENPEELVGHLAELTMDVDGGNGDKVRIRRMGLGRIAVRWIEVFRGYAE